MPQPYRGNQTTSAVEVMLERPELAAHIAYIASIWSRIDVTMGLLFSLIAGMEYRLALDIYLELKSVRLDALMAIIDGRINPKFEQQMTALRKEYRCRATERNRVVHGIWCISVDEPDALIHAGESEYIEMFSHLFRPESSDKEEELRMNKQIPMPRYMIYKKRDFEEIEERLLKFHSEINILRSDISIWRLADKLSAESRARSGGP